MSDTTSTPGGSGPSTGAGSRDYTAAELEAEERAIEAGAATAREMRDAGVQMMTACNKFMQAFIDMRLSYLKVMRAGLEDPVTMVNIMTKNAEDIARATREAQRQKD